MTSGANADIRRGRGLLRGVGWKSLSEDEYVRSFRRGDGLRFRWCAGGSAWGRKASALGDFVRDDDRSISPCGDNNPSESSDSDHVSSGTRVAGGAKDDEK